MKKIIYANLLKIKRTPIFYFHLLPPFMLTPLYFYLYGYHNSHNSYTFFILLQIFFPLWISFIVSFYIKIDQEWWGIVRKYIFLLFLFIMEVLLYEICYIACCILWKIPIPHLDMLIFAGLISIAGQMIHCIVVMGLSRRFQASIAILYGACISILTGLFENPIAQKQWLYFPFTWSIHFLNNEHAHISNQLSEWLICIGINTIVILCGLCYLSINEKMR